MAHFLYAKNWVCTSFLRRGARPGATSRRALFYVLNNLGFVSHFSLLLAQTLAAPNPPASQFLLPDVAQPRHYALDLTIVPTESTFRGTATIDLTLNQSLSFLWLNGKDLTVESAVLRAGSSNLPAKPVSAGGEFLGFVWQKTVGPGPAQLEIRYRGLLSQKAVVGIFRKRSAGDWYVFTTYTPIEARRAFPCFDEPRYKTPWELTLHVKRENVALSNTRAVSERDEPGGMKRIAFAPTVPLPSYLIAFAVGPFENCGCGPRRKNGVPVRIVTPRGRALPKLTPPEPPLRNCWPAWKSIPASRTPSTSWITWP